MPDLNEHYHSLHGSIAEAMHIYIQSGLELLTKQKNIKIFEMGLGTGLNLLCSFFYHLDYKKSIEYIAVEKFPISHKEAESLNYVKMMDRESFSDIFYAIHQSKWEKKISLSENFSMMKIHSDVQKVQFDESFDVVFYDAFAPDVQPELWDMEHLKKMYAILRKGGIFVSYCVKGEVRRTLSNLGFKVEKLKGPEGGKREILRAIKI